MSRMAMGPSYSSPWLPPVNSAVGPSPLRITVIGIRIAPQAESSRDHGSFRWPCCTPSRSKSRLQEIGLTAMASALILHEDLARHRREAAWTAVGTDDDFGGGDSPGFTEQTRGVVGNGGVGSAET